MDCVLEQGRNVAGVSASAGDDSFVDQLLNFNPENTLDDVDHHSTASSLSPLPAPLQPPSPAGDFNSLLSLPEEEADLEWLSHLVEDSLSQFCHATQPVPENSQPAVLRSRRSKRMRPSFVRSWTLSSESSSSPSSSATSSPTSPLTPLAFPDPKKKGRARAGSASTTGRRCSHCLTQKTPQWRAGPMGSKTLCNACGVRFKTGRLLPEYRPACSPTFSSGLHSNSHRKVLEMRRSKETMGQSEPGSVPADPDVL